MAPRDTIRRRTTTFPYFAAALILSLFLLFLSPSYRTPPPNPLTTPTCNFSTSSGSWIQSPTSLRPRYTPTCKEIFKGWNCRNKTSNASRWIWKPDGCSTPLPRFDAERFLDRFRGRSVGFVGDSLNRNMFVSMVCMLRQVAVGEVRKWRPAGADRGFTFLGANLTVAYHRTNLMARYGGQQAPMEVI